MIKIIKVSTTMRFELMRVTPSGFESDALTARPSCHIIKYKLNLLYNLIKIISEYI